MPAVALTCFPNSQAPSSQHTKGLLAHPHINLVLHLQNLLLIEAPNLVNSYYAQGSSRKSSPNHQNPVKYLFLGCTSAPALVILQSHCVLSFIFTACRKHISCLSTHPSTWDGVLSRYTRTICQMNEGRNKSSFQMQCMIKVVF